MTQMFVFLECFFYSQDFHRAGEHLSQKDQLQQHAFLSLSLGRFSPKKVLL